MEKNKKKWAYSIKGAREVSQRKPVLFMDYALLTFNYGSGSSFNGVLACVDIETGSEVWKFETGHFLNEPIVDEHNTIFVTCFDGSVYKIDSEGKTLWSTTPSTCNIGAPILNDRQVVYAEIAGRAKRTWSLSKIDGSTVWSFENGGHSYSLASASDDIVHSSVKGSFDQTEVNLFALNAIDGMPNWRIKYPKYLFRPTIFGDKVFVGSRGHVVCFCLHTGALLAEYKIDEDLAVTQRSLVIENAVVFCAEDGSIFSLRLASEGGGFFREAKFAFQVNWSIRGDSAIEVEIIRKDETIYMLSESGDIIAVDSSTGEESLRIGVPGFKKGYGFSVVGQDFLVATSRECIRIEGEN